jgi:carboxyl-terminal processing protease
MLRSNISLFPWLWIIVLLTVLISLLLITVYANAVPPVDEISAIMSAKALRLPSPGSLATFSDKNLDKRLLAIDPYARYVQPTSSSADISSCNLQLGIDIFVHKTRLWIQTIPGGPGDQAGLPELGILLAINSKKIQGYDLKLISSLLDKAVRKKQIILTLSSSPSCQGKDYRFSPSAYKTPSITWRRTGNDVLIGIREFVTHNTAPVFPARFATLVRPGTRVVLDLRGCSGGDLYEALEIAGMFVPAGLPLAKTYDRNGFAKIYKSPIGQKLKSPNWVLIDNKTASAAEILAGILQYHHLSIVAGEQSYGKCLSQTIFPLSDGGVLWLTTLDVRFPDNCSCTGRGVKPDIPYPDISVASMTEIFRKMTTEIPFSN